MKRFICLFVVAIMLVSIVATTAFAADTSVTVSKVETVAGGSATVSVSISGNPGINAVSLEITYDHEYLKLKKINGELLTGDAAAINPDNGIVSYSSVNGFTDNGKLLTATFDVADNAPAGEYEVSVKVKKMSHTYQNDAGEVVKDTVEPNVNAGAIIIPEPAHVHGNLTKVDYKAPTCVDDGNIEHWKCSCGSLFDAETNGNQLSADDVIIPATGEHSYGEWITEKDATCGANGSKYRECTVCHTKDTGTIPATGDHKYGEWVTDEKATCGADGTKHRVCSECQAVENGTIPATGEHTTGEWAHDPTYHWHVCKNCGKACDDIELHDWKEGDDGYYHCKCGAKGNKIDAGGKDDGKDDVPGTGDITPQITLMVVAVIAVFATAIAFVFKRKTAK